MVVAVKMVLINSYAIVHLDTVVSVAKKISMNVIQVSQTQTFINFQYNVKKSN